MKRIEFFSKQAFYGFLAFAGGLFMVVTIAKLSAQQAPAAPVKAAEQSAPVKDRDAEPAENGRLQIQFQRGMSNGSYLEEMVSMRNTSSTDFASVAWNCSFYDKEDYKVGGGASIFHLVRKRSITFDTMSFPLNGPIGSVKKIACNLIGIEKVTKENARLYQPGRQWHTASLDSGLNSGLWDDTSEPQGDADAKH